MCATEHDFQDCNIDTYPPPEFGCHLDPEIAPGGAEGGPPSEGKGAVALVGLRPSTPMALVGLRPSDPARFNFPVAKKALKKGKSKGKSERKRLLLLMVKARRQERERARKMVIKALAMVAKGMELMVKAFLDP